MNLTCLTEEQLEYYEDLIEETDESIGDGEVAEIMEELLAERVFIPMGFVGKIFVCIYMKHTLCFHKRH